MRYKPAQHRYLATVRDINPADYGGGYLVRIYPDGQPSYLALEVVEWDSDEDDATGNLYRANIPADVLKEHDWIDVDAVAEHEGMPAEDWRACATSRDPKARAYAVESIARYYGRLNLDSYPLRVTRDEIRKRWARVRNVQSKPGV